jgi:CBS domain-containing protein
VPFPISQLLQDKAEVVSVAPSSKLDVALNSMDQHDFSQLPIIDDAGRLTGLVTNESALKCLRVFQVMPEQLCVRDASVGVRHYESDADLFEVLEGMTDQFAVVITDSEKKVVGIVTDFDTSAYFRRRAEDLMLVEDIERTLRQFILLAFPEATSDDDGARLKSATQECLAPAKNLETYKRAIKKYVALSGGDVKKTDMAALASSYEILTAGSGTDKSFADLSFAECIAMFLRAATWDKYSKAIALDKSALFRMLDEVRNIRNKVAHFKGDLGGTERDTLRMCLRWFQSHESLVIDSFPQSEDPAESSSSEVDAKPSGGAVRLSKYKPLADYLRKKDSHIVASIIPFSRIEGLIGPLPPFARRHNSWWANDESSHVQSKAWLEAGWEVEWVLMDEEKVRFRRTTLGKTGMKLRRRKT